MAFDFFCGFFIRGSVMLRSAFRRFFPSGCAGMVGLATVGLMLVGCVGGGSGRGEENVGRRSAAVEEFDGDSYAAMMRVAGVARRREDYASAAVLYDRARRLETRNPEAGLALGDMLWTLGRYRSAVEAYRGALAIDSQRVEGLCGLGRSLIALEQADSAVSAYRTALERNPESRCALNGLGVAEDLVGRHEEAQKWYRTTLALAPDDVTAQGNLGYSLILSGRYEEAIMALEAASGRPGAIARDRQNLALAYGLSGREADARRVARLDLEDVVVEENLAFYRQAKRER
ncbi:TPR_REGION domain-containing protein [Azospirillaceae bacterium]